MSDQGAIIGSTVGLLTSRNVIPLALEAPRRPADLSLIAPQRPINLPSEDNPLPAIDYVQAPPVPQMNLMGQMIGRIINVTA